MNKLDNFSYGSVLNNTSISAKIPSLTGPTPVTLSGNITDILKEDMLLELKSNISQYCLFNKIQYALLDDIPSTNLVYINKNIKLCVSSEAFRNSPTDQDAYAYLFHEFNMMVDDYFYGDQPISVVEDIIPDTIISVSDILNISTGPNTHVYYRHPIATSKYYIFGKIRDVDIDNRSIRISCGIINGCKIRYLPNIGDELYHRAPSLIKNLGINKIFNKERCTRPGQVFHLNIDLYNKILIDDILPNWLERNHAENSFIICSQKIWDNFFKQLIDGSNDIKSICDISLGHKYSDSLRMSVHGIEILPVHQLYGWGAYIVNTKDFNIIDNEVKIKADSHKTAFYKNYSVVCINPANQCRIIIHDY